MALNRVVSNESKKLTIPSPMPPVGPNEVLINVDNTDKEGRTAIHRAVKARYRNMDSVFREFNGSRFIVVRKKKG